MPWILTSLHVIVCICKTRCWQMQECHKSSLISRYDTGSDSVDLNNGCTTRLNINSVLFFFVREWIWWMNWSFHSINNSKIAFIVNFRRHEKHGTIIISRKGMARDYLVSSTSIYFYSEKPGWESGTTDHHKYLPAN